MKNTIFKFFLSNIVRFAFWFRYRVEIKGLDTITKEPLPEKGGILFLPNHPAIFIDPAIIAIYTQKYFPIRPMIVEYMYNLPVVKTVMKSLNALPIPDFAKTSNSFKKKKGDLVIEEVIKGLEKGDNFLIYPAGNLKGGPKEVVGGASGVHKIITEAKDANIVLVRVKGMWGSSFSRALTGSTPPLFPSVFNGVKHVLKNLLFFTPKRKITIEFVLADASFPRNGSRLEMNRYFEHFYNQPDGLTLQEGKEPGDSLVLVSYSRWKEEIPDLSNKPWEKHKQDSHAYEVPLEVRTKIYKKLSEKTGIAESEIQDDLTLSQDLGLDSLDAADLALFLQEEFHVKNIPLDELTTVYRVMGIAIKKVVFEEDPAVTALPVASWTETPPNERAKLVEGVETIPEAFLKNADRFFKRKACVDQRGVFLTYAALKMRALLLADYIKNLEGDYIGILLPSSTAAYVVVFATMLAKKVPVMINWTLGPKHLESVVSQAHLKTVLTSSAFIEKLNAVDITPLESSLVFLEEVAGNFTLSKKMKALAYSKLPYSILKNILKLDEIKKEDVAALLFTSGTEKEPKGVPLSHLNILANTKSSLKVIDIYTDDVFIGFLPPFHSFGFTVTGMFGLLTGIRMGFMPDPNDGKGLMRAFKNWKGTVLCGAPTFIRTFLKAGTKEDVKSLRLCVTGAEKTPEDLITLLEKLGKREASIEGYGITECSPVLTANIPGMPPKGVGKALPGVNLLIVNPETMKPLPVKEVGLILAKGENVFAGYLQSTISSPFYVEEGANWYKTGDLGYLDEEGNLFISGRLKRFVKIGGEMVSLPALEDTLLREALENHLISEEEKGLSLAVVAKEGEGEKTKLYLFTTFPLNVEAANEMLKKNGYSNIARIFAAKQEVALPVLGSGKINLRDLEKKVG